MQTKFISSLLAVLMMFTVIAVTPAREDDPASAASAAVSGVLFEYDADEFTSYTISDTGRVDITFARNTPDALYSKILNKLQKHPSIKSVLAGQGGPVCSRF